MVHILARLMALKAESSSLVANSFSLVDAMRAHQAEGAMIAAAIERQGIASKKQDDAIAQFIADLQPDQVDGLTNGHANSDDIPTSEERGQSRGQSR